MKQLFIILVLITVLISIGGENSYALERPNGIGSLERPDPDDHPWGGEDQYNPIESSRTIKEPLQIKTGFMFIDIFYDFFFEIIYVRHLLNQIFLAYIQFSFHTNYPLHQRKQLS